MFVSIFQRFFMVGAVALYSVNVSAFQPPENQPAMASALSLRAPMFAVAVAGKRLVAVGMRGHILISDDNGNNWRQSLVPVSNDLLAVSFPTETKGWAVGHGGVVLHTSDAGATWIKQMSGKTSSDAALRHYEQLAQSSNNGVTEVLKEEKLFSGDSGSPSFFDVYFESDTTGYVVGTFNRIFRTVDGGKTWEPWMDRIDNPQFLNIYGVKNRNGDWYLAGERGMVWRLDSQKKRFIAVPTTYKGTFFGIFIDRENRIFVYGMRGSLFISSDKGQNWSKTETGAPAGITGVTQLSDGRVVLANQLGGYIVSDEYGKSFGAKQLASNMWNFGVSSTADDKIIFVGNKGVQVEASH